MKFVSFMRYVEKYGSARQATDENMVVLDRPQMKIW